MWAPRIIEKKDMWAASSLLRVAKCIFIKNKATNGFVAVTRASNYRIMRTSTNSEVTILESAQLIEQMKALGGVWDNKRVHQLLVDANQEQSLRSTERLLEGLSVIPSALKIEELCDEDQRPLRPVVVEALQEEAKRKRHHSLVLQVAEAEGSWVVRVNDGRLARQWVFLTSLDGDLDAQVDSLTGALDQLIQDKAALLWPQGAVLSQCRQVDCTRRNP